MKNYLYLYARFVDSTPGFGYAKVAKSLKAEWNRNLLLI